MPGTIGRPIAKNDPLDNGGVFDLIGNAINNGQRSDSFAHERVLRDALKGLGLSSNSEIKITDIDRINAISRRKEKCAELWDKSTIKAQLIIFGANPNTSPLKILSFVKDEEGNVITIEDKDKNFAITNNDFSKFEQFLRNINNNFPGHHYRILLVNEATRKNENKLRVAETFDDLAKHFEPKRLDDHPIMKMEQIFFRRRDA